MVSLRFLLLLLVGNFYLFENVVEASSCATVQGLEGCACKMQNSSKVISLQELVGNNTDGKPIRFPRTKGPRNDWMYAYHPCGTFDMFLGKKQHHEGYYACKAAAVGRFTDLSVHQCEGLGGLTETNFEYHETFEYPIVSNVAVTFVNQTSQHGARISLVCNQTLSKENTVFKYLNVTEGTIEYYHFSLTGPCSCPGGCKFTEPKPSNSIIVTPQIVLIATLSFVYALLKL